MELIINTKKISKALTGYRTELLKAYTTTTEEGLSAVNLVLYTTATHPDILRDMLIDCIENQYNYCAINRASDEIIIYTFSSIKGYSYKIK
ncbi:hypothetical protein FVR03_21715 [Pontibacter qinzhouensis]|uniref:Uncharacterized protein n=1 Tax=Pontibacter qinzhouensis TaxID=2603253 RepID=A0A5C8IXL7_9BACT|nr:hypothetical protein [Pontibacter qinzhouensis]TXK26543.1 hypothetical protein FVR03_21715 [Pontibacter qinzhouensis]